MPPARNWASASWPTANDIRSTIPRFDPDDRKHNQALVDLLVSVAGAKGRASGQIALPWLLSRRPWIVPIPGTRRLPRLMDNIGGADVVLTEDELAKIDAVAATINIQGARYSEMQERLTNL